VAFFSITDGLYPLHKQPPQASDHCNVPPL
jgi:hypothetical protein